MQMEKYKNPYRDEPIPPLEPNTLGRLAEAGVALLIALLTIYILR
jgi:hypothetical protein